MSKSKLFISFLLLLGLLYFVGPTPEVSSFNKSFPKLSSDINFLADSIRNSEISRGNIKVDNEAEIVFYNDSMPSKTEWSLVYIHGFSASQMEGNPIHREFAKKYGMNLYLARMSDHGIDTSDALYGMTAKRMWKTAKNALAVGEKLGNNVILMSTSTGGTLSLLLASKFPKKVKALMNFSPNVRVNDPFAFILNDPWGLQIARLVKGGKYNITGGENDESAKYWNNKYRLEAVVNLEELVESSMKESTFDKITCPSLTLTYYKDEENQDATVKVSAIEWMHKNLSTDNSQKRLVKLSEVGVHPLASSLFSKDLNSVREQCDLFAEEVLKLKKVDK